MIHLSSAHPQDQQAVRALLAGLAGHEWRVACGCAKALARSSEGAEEAAEGLVWALELPQPLVRTEAAASLQKLASRVPLNPTPVWKAYVGEEDASTALQLGETLLAILGNPRGELPQDSGATLHSILVRIEAGSLTRLPLNGKVAKRRRPSLSSFFRRLLSGTFKTDPGPVADRVFLRRVGNRWDDYPQVVSRVAQLYAAMPAGAPPRFALVLKLCAMPLRNFVTTEQLVVLAAKLAQTIEEQAALLSSVVGWQSDNDDTRQSRLAFSIAQARPELRPQLFVNLLEMNATVDWLNWAYSLRDASREEIEPLLARMMAAPDSQLNDWFRLLAEAPTEWILPGLQRVLE